MNIKFGSPVRYERHNSQSIPITTTDGEEVILDAKDCMSWGFQNNKYGQAQLSLVLGQSQSEFLSSLRSVRDLCVKHLEDNEYKVPTNIMRSLYEKEGKDPTLYAKVVENVLIRNEDGDEIDTPTKKRDNMCHVNAAVLVEGIFVSDTTISLQVKVCEVMILKEKKKPKRKPRF